MPTIHVEKSDTAEDIARKIRATEPSRFRKKPVEIEARQVPIWLGSKDEFDVVQYVNDSIELAKWCGGTSHMMVNPGERAYAAALVVGPHIRIETLEGPHAALEGDWIIRGVAGEFYPCKPDIFAATYEAV